MSQLRTRPGLGSESLTTHSIVPTGVKMHVILYTDGGARGNPGPAGAGVHITDKNGEVLFRGGYFLGHATNNVAEYQGMILGLERAEKLGATAVTLRSDSELIVKQLKGEYKVKNANLKPLYERVTGLLGSFEQTDVAHVYRQDNKEADQLVNEALDAAEHIGDFADGR